MIFIVGMARTGTTLMARCLNRSSDIYILNETHLIREYQHLLTSNERETISDGKECIQRIINQFITVQRKGIYRKSDFQEYPEIVNGVMKLFKGKEKNFYIELIKCLFRFEADLRGKKRFGDQTPNHVFHIDQLMISFPESVFVNMLRDPRAVILSQKNKWKASKRKKLPLYETVRNRANYHPITQSILWSRSVSAAMRAAEKFGGCKVKNVYYEDLVSTPEEQLKAVCEFIGTDYRPEMINVNVSMSSNIESSQISGIDSSLAEKWKTILSPTEIFLVELFSKKHFKHMKYEMTGAKPNLLMLAMYLLVFPLHVFFAYLLSAGRIKNPYQFFKKIF